MRGQAAIKPIAVSRSLCIAHAVPTGIPQSTQTSASATMVNYEYPKENNGFLLIGIRRRKRRKQPFKQSSS